MRLYKKQKPVGVKPNMLKNIFSLQTIIIPLLVSNRAGKNLKRIPEQFVN
jgi:hypothetical protein